MTSTTWLRDASCCAIPHTVTVEDYLKTVFALTTGGLPANTSAIATHLGIAPSSASTMLTRLREAGLVSRATWGHVLLTDHGRDHALDIVRRHRLIETFLHRQLGLGWDEVHDEAEVLEHCLSERVEERIDTLLGHPSRDPHGDPIPTKCGSHDEAGDTPLSHARVGDRFLVTRVVDRSSELLRLLGSMGVAPGARFDVLLATGDWVILQVPATGCVLILDRELVDLLSGKVITAGAGS